MYWTSVKEQGSVASRYRDRGSTTCGRTTGTILNTHRSSSSMTSTMSIMTILMSRSLRGFTLRDLASVKNKNRKGKRRSIGSTSSRVRPSFPATSVKGRPRHDGPETTHSSRRSIGATAEPREVTERDGSGTTSRGKLNEPNRTESSCLERRRAASLGCDVRDGYDDYDVYEVLPHRAGSCPRYRTAPARLAESCVLDAREASRRSRDREPVV